MAKKKILAVGVQLPDMESVPFMSNKSLLDADIIIYYPCLDRTRDTGEYYSGDSYSVSETEQVEAQLCHWREEIEAALISEKLVLVPLVRPILHKGKIRGAMGVSESYIHSYDALPTRLDLSLKEGTQIKIGNIPSYAKKYWKCLELYSKYEVVLQGGYDKKLFLTRTGNRVVGAAFELEGTMLLVPSIRCQGIAFGSWHGPKEIWQEEAIQLSKKLSGVLSEMYDIMRNEIEALPPPEWTRSPEYVIDEEAVIDEKMEAARDIISAQQHAIEELCVQKASKGEIRALLYEQGKTLERAVLRALIAFGFEARHHAEEGSEFDSLFESEEGRCLGEVEGKDNASIAIDKFSQLERNINEDLQRDEVSGPAKGVLFGNAYRLEQLSQRGTYFTEKCIQAARRTRVALVRTPDLFGPVRYLQGHSDPAYAAACRRAILETEGAIVIFPPPPTKAVSTASLD